MREAIGDLNITVIVIIAVAGLVAFFSAFVWPMITSKIGHDANCSNAVCDYVEGEEMLNCHLPGDGKNFKCPNKG